MLTTLPLLFIVSLLISFFGYCLHIHTNTTYCNRNEYEKRKDNQEITKKGGNKNTIYSENVFHSTMGKLHNKHKLEYILSGCVELYMIQIGSKGGKYPFFQDYYTLNDILIFKPYVCKFFIFIFVF